jgi:hypothetical protein
MDKNEVSSMKEVRERAGFTNLDLISSVSVFKLKREIVEQTFIINHLRR